MDRTRRRITATLLLGAAAAPVAGLPLTGCGKGGAGEGPAPGPSDAVPGPLPGSKSAPSPAVVYRARRARILPVEAGPADPALLDDALGAAVARAAGEVTPVDGFRRVFSPRDVVGIKINALAGRAMSARPEVVGRITRWLQQAGVPARQIVIFERDERELRRAGFPTSHSGPGVRVIGADGDYTFWRRDWGPSASRFTRILADEMTALINVGVLKDGGGAGVAIGMKNWYGVIHNPEQCHDDGCHPFIAHLAAYPLIRDRLRLTIVDGLTAQCHGGPLLSPRWTWAWGGFLVSTDPVALDAVGWQTLEARRLEVGLPTLAAEGRAPKWIAEGARIGLGQADLAKVTIEDV